MRGDGRENTKKLWSFISIAVPCVMVVWSGIIYIGSIECCFIMIFWLMTTYTLGWRAMSSPSVEPECIICCGSSCQDQYWSKITPKGKASFKTLIADGIQLVQKFEKLWDAKYALKNDILDHRSCKLDKSNNSKSVARKRDADIANNREEVKKQKKWSCSTGQLKILPYSNKCMLCNNPVSLYLNNSSLARKTYCRPDNESANDLTKRLLETAEKRIRINPEDTWAVQVKGRLISINDLVAEEALLHKRCNKIFSRESSFNTDSAGGRKQDDFRLELFDELCTWLETELKHSLFTLEQIHRKMISLDKSPDESLVYLKKHLRNMLVDRYQEKMYFTSQERWSDVLCFNTFMTEAVII